MLQKPLIAPQSQTTESTDRSACENTCQWAAAGLQSDAQHLVCATSRTRRLKGALRRSKLPFFWYFLPKRVSARRSRHQSQTAPDLSQRLRPRPKPIRPFHAAGPWGRHTLAHRLRDWRLLWRMSASGRARSLLGPAAVGFSALHCGGARGIQSPCHFLCMSTHCSAALLCTLAVTDGDRFQ